MTLGNLASFVGGKIGMTDAATLTKIKGFAKERYAAMYAGALWKDALSILTKAVAVNQSTIILPPHYAQFLAAKFDRTGLVPIDQSFLFASNPELWDSAGTPSHCSELHAIATATMPATAGELVSVRSTTADTGVISLHGEDGNGEPQQEQMTLNGTNKVSSVNAYAVLYGVSKGTTTGTITLRDNVGAFGGVTFVQLLPTETQRLHRRIRLHSITGEALTLLVLAKRHAGPFTQDSEATNLPSLCDQALQAMVHGDALEWQRQYGKAQGKFAEGLALLAEAKKTEIYQAAQQQRITPGDCLAEGCGGSDYL